MFAKIFNQIFDSSIVENPETRFTFMDFLILADKNGVVDMTHEAIARRTNRPLELIQKTIAELEGPDPRSRTPDDNGARIYRLDDHRDWGWGITNYEYFRKIASQDQRRERTKIRTRKWRQRLKEASQSVTGDASKRSGDDSPSASAYASVLKEGVRGRFSDWVKVRKAMGKKPKNWDSMFLEQAEWLQQFTETEQIEVLSASIRNNWQGLFEPKLSKGKREREKEPAPTGAAYRVVDPEGKPT